MQDRSADDRSQPEDRAETGPADRLSLTVSALLIGGLLLALAAVYQNAQIDKPQPLKKPPAPIARQTPPEPPARRQGVGAMAIQLPPPPVSSQEPVRRSLHKPPPRAVKKPKAADPLRRIAVAKAVPQSAKSVAPKPKPRLKPLKPAPAPPTRTRFKPVLALEASVTPPTISAKDIVDGTRNTKTGGALLRLLEHGQGPTIEIAWPQRAQARRALYRQLSLCYGVRPAVLAGGAKLFADAGAAGQAWSIDMDRFSGFIRSPQGEAVAEEAQVFAGIADRHGLTDWRPVRVFPRHVDAALLGGLGALLGPHYKSAKQIRAAYRWDRARLILGDFTVDGRPLAGAVTLPLPRRRDRGPGCD